MVWSNWQGAAWRGAVVVVLICSGLAWTQAPVQQPGDPADRIMTVHENGRKIRCRVEETWQLPDGRVAHLLQALETGERITIVDDQAAPLDPTVNSSKAVPKRIFAWGPGQKTPPEGSPIPPHLRIESGLVFNQDAPPPAGYKIANTVKPGDAQVVDVQKAKASSPTLAQVGATQSTGSVQIILPHDPNDKGTPPIIQIGEATPPISVPAVPSALPGVQSTPVANVMPTPVVPSIQSAPATNVVQAPAVPSAVPSTPATLAATTTTTAAPQVSASPSANPPVYIVDDPSMRRPWRPGDRIMDWLQNRNGGTVTREYPASDAGVVVQPAVSSGVVTGSAGQVTVEPKVVQDTTVETEKRPWRPGDRIVNWFSGKSQTSAPKTEAVKVAEAKKTEMPPTLPKMDEDLKIQKTEDYLAQQNKPLDKKLEEKISKAPTGPFSTAMGAQPDVKKVELPALAVSNSGTVTDPKTDKGAAMPPPLPGEVKPAAGPTADKKDMWGLGAADGVLPPSKSAVEGAVPTTRVNDPLTMPERFVDKRGPMTTDLMPGDPGMGGYPLGAQSVIAARSGMIGQVTYVPVPTVTVPQPFNPPTPPEPKMPSPPELNAYVNAFTPPPQPKGTQEYIPMQGMMPAQAMNPAMQQQMAMQQYMMQQQMMQQQAMQQQGMNPYAYRPANYPQPVSQGPTMNFARQYQGPQAPNPFGPGPVMPASYMPMPYPPMQPQQQPMAPQQQPVQQAGFQQPSPAMSQVDQLIKVLRESPYPAQREWAAQSLANFEWRSQPQIVPNLLQSASQDPAGTVRAGCVTSLGRMQAAIEPVYTTLNAMRNDSDPRVRQEVQQTLVRLGQPSGN